MRWLYWPTFIGILLVLSMRQFKVFLQCVIQTKYGPVSFHTAMLPHNPGELDIFSHTSRPHIVITLKLQLFGIWLELAEFPTKVHCGAVFLLFLVKREVYAILSSLVVGCTRELSFRKKTFYENSSNVCFPCSKTHDWFSQILSTYMNVLCPLVPKLFDAVRYVGSRSTCVYQKMLHPNKIGKVKLLSGHFCYQCWSIKFLSRTFLCCMFCSKSTWMNVGTERGGAV